MTIQTNWKIKSPQKKKKIETKDEAEAARYKAAGYFQKKLKSGKIVLEKKFQKWELFQENVRIFLEALSFEDTESGQASWLGRYQIEQAIREKFGSKYNEVKFILALENIDITEDDEKTAKENDVYLWGSNYLKTCGDLFSIIG